MLKQLWNIEQVLNVFWENDMETNKTKMLVRAIKLETQIEMLGRGQKDLQERIKHLECDKHIWIFVEKQYDIWFNDFFYCFKCNNCGKKISHTETNLTKTMRLQLEVIGILKKRLKRKNNMP